MDSYFTKMTDKKSIAFADQVTGYFKSLPNLPTGIVEFLVKITPIFAIVGAVLMIIAGPLALLASFTLLAQNMFAFVGVVVGAIVSIVSALILFKAYPLLKNHKFNGWMFLFWVQVLSFVEQIVRIAVGQSTVFGLVGVLLGVYILSQMRSHYK